MIPLFPMSTFRFSTVYLPFLLVLSFLPFPSNTLFHWLGLPHGAGIGGGELYSSRNTLSHLYHVKHILSSYALFFLLLISSKKHRSPFKTNEPAKRHI